MEGELTIPGEFRLVNDSEQDSRTQDDSVEIVAVTSEQCYLDRFVDRREQTIAIDSSSRYNVFKLQFCPVFSNVRISNISGHLVTDKLTHMTILKSSSEDGKEYFSSEQCLRASSVSMTEVALGNIVDEHSDMRKTGGSGEIFTDTGQNTFDQEKFYMGSSLLEPTHDRDMGTCSMQNVQSRHQTDTTARVLGSTATAFFAALAQPINYAETSCSSGVGELSEYVPSSHDTNIVSRFETAFSVDDDRGKNQVTLRLLERRKTIEIDMDDLSGLEVRHTSNLNFSFSSREQQQHHSMRSAVNIVWAKTIDTDEVSTKKRLFRTELRWNPFSSTSLDDSMDDFSSDMSFDTIVTSDSAGSFVKTVDSLYTSDCNDSFLEENLVYSGSLDTKSTLALREHEEQEFTNNAVHIRALPMFSNVYVDVTKTYDITSHGKMVQQQLQVGLVEKADDTMVGHPLDRKMLYKVSDGIANLGRGASDMEPAAQRFRCLAHQDCVPVAGQADIHYPVAEDYRLRILDDLVSNCQSPSDEIYNSHAIGGNMQKSEPGFSFEVVRQTVKQKQKDIRDVQFDGNTNVRLHAMKDLRHLQLPDRSIAQTNIAANVSRSNTGDSLDTTDTSVWNQTRWLQKDLRLTQPGENAVVTASNIKQLATLNLDDRGNLRLPQNSSHARAHYFLDDNGEKTDEPLDIYKPVNVSSNAVFNLNSVKSVAADTITTDHCITTEPSLSNGMYGDHCNINTNTDYEVTFMARGKSSFGIDAAVDVVSRAIYLNVTEKPTADLNASGVECKNYSSHTMTCKTNVIAAKYTVKEKSACDETIMKCVERTEQLLQTPGSTAYQRRVQDSMEISATEPCNGSTDIQRINESKAEMNLQLSNDNALERTEATDSFDDNNDGFVLVTSRRKTKLHNKKFQPKDVTDIPTDSNGDKRTKDSHNSNSRHRVLPCQIAQPASSSSLLACFGNKKSATITLCPNSAQNSQDETEVEKLSPMSVVSPSEPVHADIHDAHACNIDIACASIERAINGKPLLEKALPMHEVQCSDNNTELSTTDLTTAEIIFGPEAIIESFVFRSERKNSHERDTNGETVSKKDSFKTVSEDCISEIFISRMMEGTSAYSQEYGEAFLHSDKCGGVLLNMYTGGRRQILKPHSKFTKPDRQTTSRSGDNESDCTVPDTKLEEEQKSARHCTVNISDFNASAVGTLLNRSITKAGRRRGKGNKRKFEGISNVETSMPNSQISELNVTDDSGSIDASLECLEDIGNDFDVCMSDDDTDVNSDKYAPIFHQPDEADEMNQHLDLHVGEIMCASADVKDIDLSHNSSVNTVADLDTQDGLIYKESNSETTTWKPSVPIKEINDKKLTFVPYSADVELDAAHIIVQSVEVDTRCQNMLGHDIEDSFAITEPCDQEGNMLMPNLRQESFVDKSETFSNTYSAAKVTVTKQSDVASEHLANIREEVVTTVNSAVPSFDNIAEFGYLCSQSESSDQYLSSVHFLKDAGVPSYTVDLDTDSALTNTIKSGVVIETGQRSQPFQELVSVKSVLGSHDSSNEDDLLHLLDVSARIGTILIENDKTVHDYVDDNIQENTDKADGTFYEKVGNGQLTIADHEVEKGTCVNVKLNISDEYFQSTSDKDKKTWRRKETSDATTYNKYTTTVDSEQKVIQAHYKNRKVEDTENREIKFSSKEKIINLSDLILENCVNTRNSADDNVTITENVGWRIGDALWESVKKQERRDYPKEEIQVTVENTIDFFEDINENIGNDQWESDGEDIDNVKWESDNEEQHGREMTDIAKMSRNMSLVCKEEDLIEDGMYYRVTEIDSVKVVSDVRQEQDLDDRRREISDSSAVLRNYETTTDDMNWKSNDEEDEVKNGILNRIQENIYIGGHGTMDNIVTDNVEWKVEESCDVKWERSIEMQDGVEDVTVVIISSNGMRTVDRHEYFCEDRLALGSKGIDSVKCNIREKKNEGQGNDVAEKNQDDRAEDKGTDIVEWAFEGIGGVKWDRVEEEDRRQEYIDRNRVQEASNESVIHKIGEMRLDNHLIVEDIGDAKWQIDDNNRDGKNILKYRIQENTQEHVGYRIREKNEDHVVSRVEDFRGENWQIGDENEDERSALGYTIQESNEEYVVNIVEGIRTDHVQRNVDVKLERGYGDKEPKAKFIDGSKENRNTGPIGRGVDHNRNNEEWNVEDTGDVKWDVNNKEDDNHINNQTDEILLRRNQSKVNRNDTPETNNVEWRIEDVDYVKLYGDVQKIYQIDGVLDRTQENVCGLENSLSDNVEWRVQHFGVVKSGSDDKLEEPIRNLDDKVIEIRNSRASEIIQDFIEDRVECGVADTQLSRDIDEGRLCEIFYGSQETNKKGAISNICDIHVDSIQRPVDGINNNKCKSGGENKDQREDLADNIESFDASNVVCIKKTSMSDGGSCSVEDDDNMKYESYDEFEEQRDCLAHTIQETEHTSLVYATGELQGNTNQWRVEAANDLKWENDEENVGSGDDRPDTTQEIIEFDAVDRTEHCVGDNVLRRNDYISDLKWGSTGECEELKDNLTDRSFRSCVDKIRYVVAENTTSKIIDNVKLEYTLDDNEIINDPEDHTHENKVEVATDIEKGVKDFDLKLKTDDVDSENPVGRSGGNKELNDQNTVASVLASHNGHSIQQRDIVWSASSTKHTDNERNKQIQSSVIQSADNAITTRQPVAVGFTEAITNSSESTSYRDYINPLVEKFTCCNRSVNHHISINVDSSLESSGISHSAVDAVNTGGNVIMYAPVYVKAASPPTDIKVKITLSESKQKRKKIKKKKNMKYEKKNAQARALEQTANVKEPLGENPTASEVMGVAASSQQLSVHCCTDDSAVGASVGELTTLLVIGHVRQAEKRSGNTVTKPVDSLKFTEVCSICENTRIMETLNTTAEVENDKTESKTEQFVGKVEASHNGSITPANLCQLPSSDNFECVEYVSANKAEQWVHVDNSSCFDTTLLKGIRSASSSCREDHAIVSMDSVSEFQTDYLSHPFVERREIFLPPIHKPVVFKVPHLVEDVILNKARAEELIAQNPEASQKHIIHDFKSSLEEATLTPGGHLMSEIDLLETSTRDQWESLQVAVAQQQIYETEFHHLSHVIDEAQKQLQASSINAASVGELRQLMAERTNLTEQIKYYNIKIQEVNEKMRQLALDSAQLSPSVFRKHYHPESAYSDYFAATSQHKRGVFPFHSPGQLFYDSLPVFNFPSFSDEESSSPLARAFQDEHESWKQSELPKSVYGITPISLQLPRLIPPPRTDSIPRPTWSGEILATAASLSDMTRGTSISHSVDSPRTMAKAFEASASSPKSIGAVSVPNKQTHEVCISTATTEANPENVLSIDAANTVTTDSNTGEPSTNVLSCDTYTSATNAASKKLRLFAKSAQTQAPVDERPNEILLFHGFVNENNQRPTNDCNTSSECDPKTDESSSTDWVLASSPSTETQQHDRDTDCQNNMSSPGAEVKVTPNVHVGKAKTESVHMSIPGEMPQVAQGQDIQVQITKQFQKLSDPMLRCDSLSDEDPIAAQKLHTDILALQGDIKQIKKGTTEKHLRLEASTSKTVDNEIGQADELSLDIRNHTQLINEIADQRRYPGLSASNITTDAEVKENWEKLNRDLAQRTKDLEYILRTQKPEDLVKISLHAPAKHAESTKEFEKVVKLVADLNSACNLLQTLLNKNQLDPKEALPFQEKHQLVLQNISDWLDLAEQQLFTVPISTEEQIRHNENLRRQIQCLQINVDEMSKRPKDQAESTFSTNRELIEECHSNLHERLNMIDTTTKLQADHLHQTEKQWKQYQIKVANLQRQLQDIPKAILLPTATHSLDQLMCNNQKTEEQLKICEDQLQELKTMESSLTQKYPKGFFMSELIPLQSKYVELQRKALEKKSAIQNLIIFQDQYKKMLKDCADFIDMAEDKLRADYLATKDLSHIKSQLAAFKDFFSDIETHKATLDSLASSCDPSTRIQFQQQHASLSTRILVLVDQASLHGHRLEHLTHQWAHLEAKYTMLQEVLLALEAQMSESVDSFNSLAAIQDKCNKYKWLQGELAASRDTLIEVMKGKRILHSINCPSLETTITQLAQKWLSLNTKLTHELKRTESLGDLLSVFETELAILSSWLITAKMKLDGFKNLSAASLQNISAVRSEVEKILEFSKEVANQVLFKNKVMSIGHQLLETNTCDTRSLSGRLQDCEEQWKQLERGVAETQEYLLQVQMKLMPSRQVLKELTDWIGELSKSVEKDACFVTSTSLDIEYMVKKYKSYQIELAGRQMSLDFVNHVVLSPQAADVSVSQEKLQFSENLQELNKHWHQMTIEINDKLNTLEDVYSKWVEYGKAVEKLQSWFHQQEDKIQSYRLIGTEVEVKQTLEDCSVLQQQLQFKQFELAGASALGNYLIELSHDSPDSQQSIKDSLSTLDHKMKRLEEHTKQHHSVLTDVLGHWTQYHSDLAILNQVVTQADYALDHYKLFRGDIATLQSQRIKLKDLHTYLEKNNGQLKSFSAVANELRQVCELSVQVDIQKTVSGMQNKWTQLSTDLIQRCTEYEHYLDEWQLFEKQCSRMQDWLDTKEALCIDLDSVTIDSLFPETLTKCTQLQQELDSFQSQVADLHRLNEMVTNHMNQSTVSIMKSRQLAIDQKLLALKQKLYQLSVTMSDYLSMHEKFENIFGAVRKFLSYVEVILDVDDPMKTAELEAIQLRFEQLSNLLLLFSHSYKELDDVNDLGYQLALSTSDATRLQELNHKWYMLYEDTKDRSRTLQGNLLQQQDFTSKCEAWKTFMIHTEQMLAGKVKGNLADLLAHLHNSEQFENELYSRQQIIHAIISDGQKMMGTREVKDNDEFQRKLNLVFEQWQSISRKVSQRKIAIKEIVNKWHTFNALSQQLKTWVKNTENYLQTSPSESNSLQVIKNSIGKLQEVQNEFQMQEATYNNILDLGGHLKQHADNRAAKEIKDTLSDIQQNRHKILSVVEQHRLQLEDIAQQWLGCESEVDDMLCQLTEIRSILNTDIPTTYDELQGEMNRCKSIEKEFIQSENKEQSLLAKERQLVMIIQTVDVSLLQQRIQLLTKQRRELQHQTKVREDKIVEALIRGCKHRETVMNLKQWDTSMSNLSQQLSAEKNMLNEDITFNGNDLRHVEAKLQHSKAEDKSTKYSTENIHQNLDADRAKELQNVPGNCAKQKQILELKKYMEEPSPESPAGRQISHAYNSKESVSLSRAAPVTTSEYELQVQRSHSPSLLQSRSPALKSMKITGSISSHRRLSQSQRSPTGLAIDITGQTEISFLMEQLAETLNGCNIKLAMLEQTLRRSGDTEQSSSWIQYQEVLTAIDDYHLWLEKTETQVRHCETVNSSLSQSALLEKYTKLQELHNEVINNQTTILTLKEAANQLLKSMEFPELSTARDKIYIVHKRVQALTPLILSYSTALEKRLKTTPKKEAQATWEVQA